jgi:pimeloyl-ACP methyl ester carboxylesterase
MWAMSQPFSKARFEGGDTLDFRSDFIDMHKVTAQSDHPLQNIPLIVLSKTPSIDNDDDYTPDQLAWNQNLQAPLARLSTNSGHIVADHSGHHIQLDEPDIVTASIFRIIDSVKHHRPLKDEPPSRR